MNEQTVSDERLRSIETWAADVSNPNPVLQKTWAAFASHYADDIAAICRELLARREVAAEDAKRMREVMRDCDGISSSNEDYTAFIVSFTNREASDKFLALIDPGATDHA